MTETPVSIRQLTIADLPVLVDLDHGYNTDYVWQMDIEAPEKETRISFREIRLPRAMYVHYPRPANHLADTWEAHDLVLVAETQDEKPVAYMTLNVSTERDEVGLYDLVVNRIYRRKGIGTQLVRAAQQWALQQHCTQLKMETQSKNHPAIALAGKMGFDFSGYNDRYYANGDIALFFVKKLV